MGIYGNGMHTSQFLGLFRFKVKMTFISHVILSDSQSALYKFTHSTIFSVHFLKYLNEDNVLLWVFHDT